MWWPGQKLSVALPSPTIARIKHPESLSRDKLRERLLARNRGHAVAQNDHLLLLSRSSGRQKFSQNFVFETSSEHVAALSLMPPKSERQIVAISSSSGKLRRFGKLRTANPRPTYRGG